MTELANAERWWEDVLTDAQRTKFLNGTTWGGTDTQRQERLLSFYRDNVGRMIEQKNNLLKACINRLTPTQAQEILEEMPELLERGFPDEWSANEKLWSYTED